jgi:hypothetical protein
MSGGPWPGICEMKEAVPNLPRRLPRAGRPGKRPKIRCGIDTGGTFTDLIGIDEDSGDLIVGKFPSSPKDPVKSIVGVNLRKRSKS